MADAYNFNPRNITLGWGAVLVDSGWADGTFVNVEVDNDETTEVEGADGSVTIVENPGRLATVTITLQQSAPKNAELMAVVEAGRIAGVRPILPFVLNDRGGTTVISAEKCWLKKRPAVEFSKEATQRVWTFKMLWDEFFVGGN